VLKFKRKFRHLKVKEDPALYPHTCIGPVTYMGTVVTKWAMKCLAFGSTLHAVEAISLSTSSTKTAIGRYSLLTTPTKITNT
jgi:hypothetical protein